MAMQEPSGQLDSPERTRPMTRAVLLGLGLVVGIDVLAIHVKYLLPRGPMMAYSHVPMVVLIGFVLMLLVGAVVARGTRQPLSPSEWHTILAMGIVGAAVLLYGYSGYLISYMGAPHYFATGENEWANYLHPYISEWLFPGNEEQAVTWFWEGLPRGAQLPWGKWILPLFWWGGLTLAAFVLYACVTTIFRKQWIHYEKVAFPAMAPLVEMASHPGDGKGFLPAFTRNTLFWIGFWIVFGMIAWNCVNYFIPTFPQFPIYAQGSAAHQGGRWIWIDRNFPPIYGILDIFTICFSYFATVEVLFSIWFFDLLFILEGGLLNRIGFVATSPYYYSGVCSWQTKGAFFFLVLSTTWAARSQIRDVFWKALDPQAPVDDRDEPLSYRTAVAGLAISLIYIWVWLVRIGFDPFQAVLLIFGAIFTYLGLARILSDTGLPYVNAPIWGGWGLVSPFLDGESIHASTRVAARTSGVLLSNFKGSFLPALSQAGRVAEGVQVESRRQLTGAVFLAFVTSVVTCVLVTLYLGYRHGALNFTGWVAIRSGNPHYDRTAKSVRSFLMQDTDAPIFIEHPDQFAFFVLGALATALLFLLRRRFPWWPLHPVGLTISGSFLARRTSLTILVAWLIRWITVKVGGASSYQKSRPLFLGLLVGYVLGVVLSLFIDLIWFPEQGHMVHRL